MNIRPLAILALSGAMFPSAVPAQAAETAAPSFAKPVRLHAGDKLLGTGRLYPSPVAHDINGDKLLDIVVGDLRGHLTFALRQPGEEATYAEEQKLKDAEGKILDFGNW